MKKLVLFASLLVMSFISSGCTLNNDSNGNITYIYNDVDVDENDDKSMIYGVVTCRDNPVSGVTITYGNKTAYSMIDGTFKLRSVDLLDGKVTFSKTGYYDFRAKLNVEEIKEKNVMVNCQLETIAFVEGSVCDTWGNVLSDATITIEGTDISTKTNSNGKYTLTGLVESDFMVSASKNGYQTVRHLVRKEWFSDSGVTAFDFQCHKLGKLSGTIKDKTSNKALANVKVVCGSDITYSNEFGYYELNNIYPENKDSRTSIGFEVEYSLTGYTTTVINVDFYSASNYEVSKDVSLVKE